ncbi:MAG: hypothetical protein WBD36_07625, partial [Bacteroidota bacterium]
IALADLIDGIPGITDNMDLDVYVLWHEDDFPTRRRQSRRRLKAHPFTEKSEQSTIMTVARQSRRMRRRHNVLTARFIAAIRWKYGLPLEGNFDLLIPQWRRNRHLIIEAKTSSRGSAGRFHIRTAIGQLYDYRHSLQKLEPRNYDLAILLPRKPPRDIMDLLQTLGIYMIWFEQDQLGGTARL